MKKKPTTKKKFCESQNLKYLHDYYKSHETKTFAPPTELINYSTLTALKKCKHQKLMHLTEVLFTALMSSVFVAGLVAYAYIIYKLL